MISFSSLGTAAGVSNKVASTVPCGLIRVQGYMRTIATGQAYLQLHDAPTAALCTTSTLKKAYELQASFAFSWAFDKLFEFRNGLTFILASTATDPGDAITDKMDIFGDIEPRSNWPTDYTESAVTADTDELWAFADGPKTLYEVTAACDATATEVWLLVMNTADDTTYYVVEAIPLFVDNAGTITNIASLTLNFGAAGLSLPFVRESRTGCTVCISTDPDEYTAVGSGTNTVTAKFK